MPYPIQGTEDELPQRLVLDVRFADYKQLHELLVYLKLGVFPPSGTLADNRLRGEYQVLSDSDGE